MGFTFHYDPQGRVSVVLDPLQNPTRFEYDDQSGGPLHTVDARQRGAAYFQYDGNGHVLSATSGLDLSRADHQVLLNALGDPYVRELGIAITPPAGTATTSYTYYTSTNDSGGAGAAGDRRSATDPAGNTTFFRYDQNGNLTHSLADWIDPYDSNPTPLQVTLTTTTEYDGNDQARTVRAPTGVRLVEGEPVVDTSSTTYVPDGNGQLARVESLPAGKPVAETNGTVAGGRARTAIGAWARNC